MKKIKRYKAEKPLSYLEGDYLAQTYRIYHLLSEAYSLGLHKSGKKSAQDKINQAYIHLSRLVHSM